MAQQLDPLTHLERTDKWYLGGGRSTCFAPPFPLWLGKLGFWDEAHFVEVPLPRLFTCFLVDEQGTPLTLQPTGRSWRPDRLRQTFAVEGDPGLVVREQKVLLAEDVFASHISLSNRGEENREIDIIVWTLREKLAPESEGLSLQDVTVAEGTARYREQLLSPSGQVGEFYFCLGANHDLRSASVNLTEETCGQPLWEVSVLPEKFSQGRLAADRKLAVGPRPEGEVQIALHYRLTIPPHERRELTTACAVSLEPEAACRNHQQSLQVDVVATAVSQWRQYFEGVPYFSCSDPYLTRYYWYRWYGLRLCMVDPRGGNLRQPCVTEGIGGFRRFISYSAQCHLLECSWMHDPAYARGSLQGMLDHQLPGGQLRGSVGVYQRSDIFYHANWGAHTRQLLAIHPDARWAAAIYEPLARYARYFDRERDREQSGLYDVIMQGETGQEYMARYQAVHPEADQWVRLQLKGVDASVYIYELKRLLADLAHQAGREGEAQQWAAEAAVTGKAIREQMWEAASELFYDCDPATGEPTGCQAAVCFYPLLTDLTGPEHLGAVRQHLLNPREFWLPAGPPATSAADESYSAHAEWKGKRMSCPWNGRLWPMTASHLCSALARVAREHDESLRPQAAELIRRFITTMFFKQNPTLPNCFEHYNPVTAEPSAYRGIDDYQHSWVVDLIIQQVAGIQPRAAEKLLVDPLDFGLQQFELREVPFRGHRIDVIYGPDQPTEPPVLQVLVDGQLQGQRAGLGPLEVPLS
jgi:hypothetical protein